MSHNLETLAKFTPALNQFMDYVKAMRAEYYAKNFPNLKQEGLKYQVGKKNVKLILTNENGENRSVYAFIDIETGDIFKAASWAAPAKHARGNVYNPESFNCATPFGIVYLR